MPGRLGGLVAALVLVAAGAPACSSEDPAPPTDSTAAAVAEVFLLSGGSVTCLQQRLEAAPDARRAVVATDELSESEEQALGDVLEACVGTDQLAGAFAARTAHALPPADPDQGPAQTACVEQAVRDLDEGQRRSLEVGLVTLAGPLESDLALRRNDVVNLLYGACDVSPPS